MHSLGFTSMKRAREGVDVTVTLQMLAWVKKRCGTIRCKSSFARVIATRISFGNDIPVLSFRQLRSISAAGAPLPVVERLTISPIPTSEVGLFF
jgi:hypothetical protein